MVARLVSKQVFLVIVSLGASRIVATKMFIPGECWPSFALIETTPSGELRRVHTFERF